LQTHFLHSQYFFCFVHAFHLLIVGACVNLSYFPMVELECRVAFTFQTVLCFLCCVMGLVVMLYPVFYCRTHCMLYIACVLLWSTLSIVLYPVFYCGPHYLLCCTLCSIGVYTLRVVLYPVFYCGPHCVLCCTYLLWSTLCVVLYVYPVFYCGPHCVLCCTLCSIVVHIVCCAVHCVLLWSTLCVVLFCCTLCSIVVGYAVPYSKKSSRNL